MSPSRPDIAAVDLTEATPVRTDIKTLIALGGALILLVTGWVVLKVGLADAQTRISTLESAKVRTAEILQEQAVVNQRVTDSLEHIRETTDQTARDVREMQKRGHR